MAAPYQIRWMEGFPQPPEAHIRFNDGCSLLDPVLQPLLDAIVAAAP